MTQQVISNGGTQLATEEWTYDGNGNVTDQIDIITLGMSTQTRETRYSYDAMGHVTQEIDAYGTSLAATTITDYDANGHLTEEIDTAGNTTLFQYDAAGNETWTQNAMGYTSTMKYDGNNHLTSEVDADGRLQTFTYDAQGLETGNSWFSGGTTSTTETESISFAYDLSGNETLASNSDGTYSLSYNPLNEVTRVVEPVGVTLSMGYDGSGNRTLLQDSLGGTTSSAYDTDNELTTEIYTQSGVTGALRMDTQYDWLGRVVEQERYSDTAGTTLVATTAYTYDAAGNITDLDEVNSASTLIANYTMGYDGIGELTQQTDHGSMTVYSYDQLGQLTSGGGTSQTYTASGNRTTDTTIAGNEVTYDGNYSYAYDHEGNETAMWDAGVTWAYSYDNDNHMTEAVETVSTTTAMEVDYKYDAFGNMTEETVITGATTTATQFVLDGFNPAKAGATGLSGWNKIADLNGSGSLITHYVWGNGIDQLLGRYDTTLASDPSGIYSTMTDPNGSVRDIINNSGAYIASVQYDAFGNVLSISSPGALVADPGDYLGHYTYDTYDYDAATGNYDVNARVYSSAGGRWLSQDPMGFDAGDSNLYRYVRNSPVDEVDASGLQPPFQSQPSGGTGVGIFYTPQAISPGVVLGTLTPRVAQRYNFPPPIPPMPPMPPAVQFIPKTLSDFLDVLNKADPQELANAIQTYSKFTGVALDNANNIQKFGQNRYFVTVTKVEAETGPFVRFGFASFTGFKINPNVNQADLLQQVKCIKTTTDLNGNEKSVEFLNYLEGWKLNNAGVVMGVDSHAVSGTLLATDCKKQQFLFTLTVGPGIYNNRRIDGTWGDLKVKGIFDQVFKYNSKDIAWMGPRETYTVSMTIDANGNWTFSDPCVPGIPKDGGKAGLFSGN